MAKFTRKSVKRLSELLDGFVGNSQPITFLGAVPYGCLGLDGWISKFEYISALDCVPGLHRGAFSPESDRPTHFTSAADSCNELLRHAEVRAHLNSRGTGFLWPADADEETYFLAKELGQTIILAKPDLRRRIMQPDTLRALLAKSGVAFVPSCCCQCNKLRGTGCSGTEGKTWHEFCCTVYRCHRRCAHSLCVFTKRLVETRRHSCRAGVEGKPICIAPELQRRKCCLSNWRCSWPCVANIQSAGDGWKSGKLRSRQ